MIRLATVIEQFETDFFSAYGQTLLASQRKALSAINNCRSSHSPLMQTSCADCGHIAYVPHSCGHRSCPHCQNHDKSTGKSICTALAARRVKVHGCTFMIGNSGLNDKAKKAYLLIIL